MSRIQSVDIFRLLAIIAVIAIHTSPFKMASTNHHDIYKFLEILINQLSRFAVPFFFVISGYFLGIKLRAGHDPAQTIIKMASRIAVIFFAWCLIYLLPYDISKISEYGILGPIKVVYWNLSYLVKHPLLLLMQGTKSHLWFLASLVYSLFLSLFFLRKNWIKTIFILSLILYVFGVFSKAYVDTPIGININFNTRNGPFFSTLPFITGYYLSKFETNHKWLLHGFVVFIFGCIAHFSEIYILWDFYGTSVFQDFVFGTYFMGVGVALVSLSNHPWLNSLWMKKIGGIGQMTLGIYAIQFIYIDLFSVVDKNINNPVWEISYIFLILILSALTSILLSKNKFTRKIVL